MTNPADIRIFPECCAVARSPGISGGGVWAAAVVINIAIDANVVTIQFLDMTYASYLRKN
jgi:hypothetical protein